MTWNGHEDRQYCLRVELYTPIVIFFLFCCIISNRSWSSLTLAIGKNFIRYIKDINFFVEALLMPCVMSLRYRDVFPGVWTSKRVTLIEEKIMGYHILSNMSVSGVWHRHDNNLEESMHLNSQGYQIGLRMPLAYFVKKLGVRCNEAFLWVRTLFPPLHPRKHTAQ